MRPLARIAGPEDIIPQVIRPMDVAMQGRYAQQPARESMARFTKWVKTAVTRNATAIASLKFRVYRRTGKPTAFDTRRLSKRILAQRLKGWGAQLGKAISPEDDIEEITDHYHPLITLLREGWPMGSGFELLEGTETYQSLAGDAFWALVDGPSGWPVEAWPLHPKDIRVVPRREETVVDYYVYGRGTEVERSYLPEAVVHFRRFNPTGDPTRGYGDLAACWEDADLSLAFTRYSMALIDQGGHPSAILNAKGATEKQITEIERRINAKGAGLDKAGRIWVVNGNEIDVKILDTGTGKERPFIQSEAMALKVIAAAFDVPEAMLTMDGAALATEKSVIPHWQRYGVQPRAIRMQDRMNASLVPRFAVPLNDPTLFVAVDPAVDEDVAASTDRATKLYLADLTTKNESRIEAGLDPLEGPEGDEFHSAQQVQLQQMQIDSMEARGATEGRAQDKMLAEWAGLKATIQEYANARTDDRDDRSIPHRLNGHAAIPGAEAQVPGVREDPERADHAQRGLQVHPDGTDAEPAGAAGPAVDKGAPAPLVTAGTPDADNGTDAEALDRSKAEPGAVPNPWLDHHAQKDDKHPPSAEELAFQRDMRKVIDSLAQQVYEAQAIGSSPQHVATLMEQIRFAEQIANGAAPHITDQFAIGYDRGALNVAENVPGATVDPFSLVNQDAVDYLDRYTIKLTNSVRQRYEEQLTAILQDGIRAGQTNAEIATAMRDTMTGQSAAAAETIARTESSNAFNSGREAAWARSGVVEAKEWLLGGNPCPICVALAEQYNQVPVGESFLNLGDTLQTSEGPHTVTYRSIDGPPAHPNCTCSLGAVFKPVEAANVEQPD